MGTTYERRKAQGLCPWCALPIVPPAVVYCLDCTAEMARRFDLALTAGERERRRRYHATKATQYASEVLPECLGHLACCGQWHPIPTTPMTVPCCGRLWLINDGRPEGADNTRRALGPPLAQERAEG